MIKAHKHANQPMIKRSSRVYLNELNPGKAKILVAFLILCRNITQYFIDLFWQRQDFSASLADLETVHRGRDRFGVTTRLAQALAKQAKEIVRSQHKTRNLKPNLHKFSTTLYYHFVRVERFKDGMFDWAIVLTGSGAPRMVIPVQSTSHLNKLLQRGFCISKTIRLGMDANHRLFVDFILEKPRPPLKTEGRVVGMDSNYKNGLVFSDGQQVATHLYDLIQGFDKREKHTRRQIKDELAHEIKKIDLSTIKVIAIEDLKRVKDGKRGKFSRTFNRRLSHWMYAYAVDLLERRCEEEGIRLERKDPWKTSQHCPVCGRWDRRNRKGEKFCCVFCGHSDEADFKAAQTLELLGLAGVYGLRVLPSLTLCSVRQSLE